MTYQPLTTNASSRRPGWDYVNFRNGRAVVADRCLHLLLRLGRGEVDTETGSKDTRVHHENFFVDLTPGNCTYFAGHYRGEDYRCIRHYNVGVRMDSRVGVDARRVARDMANLHHNLIQPGFAALKSTLQNPQVSPGVRLLRVVEAACEVLEEFLRIHPYANGNGHMGRLIVWFFLVRFDYWPKRWPLNESPEYHTFLSMYRDGKKELLIRYVLECVH